jgi:hypothetical protein
MPCNFVINVYYDFGWGPAFCSFTVEVFGLFSVLRTEATGCLKIFIPTKLHGVTFQKTMVNVLCSCLFFFYKRKIIQVAVMITMSDTILRADQ